MRKAIKTLNDYVKYISGLACVVLLFITVGDVGSRIAFRRSIDGIYELTLIMLTVIVYLAVAYAQDHKEHITIDTVYELMPFKLKRVISWVTTLIYLGVVSLMCVEVFKFALKQHANQDISSSLGIPMWPYTMVAAFGLACYVLSIIADVVYLIEGGVLNNDAD